MISYLAKLGLGDEDLTRVISLLHTGKEEIATLPMQREETMQALLEEDLLETKFDLFVKTPRQPGARWG